MFANLPTELRSKGFDTENKAIAAQFVDGYVALAARLATLASEQASVRGAIESFLGTSCNQTTDLEGGCGQEVARKFADAFEAAVRERLPGGGISPRTDYDADVAMGELDGEFFAVLDRLGPFGNGNPEPMVQVSGVSIVARPRLFGANADHLKAAITDAGGSAYGMIRFSPPQWMRSTTTTCPRFSTTTTPLLVVIAVAASIHLLSAVDGKLVGRKKVDGDGISVPLASDGERIFVQDNSTDLTAYSVHGASQGEAAGE